MRTEIDVDDFVPMLGRHLVQHGVARDAGIVDEHVDRAERAFDVLDAGGAGREIADIPFEDGDAGLGLELLRGLVIAAHNSPRPCSRHS